MTDKVASARENLLRVGSTDYDSVGFVAEGGYGRVFKARNTRSGHPVALKELEMTYERMALKENLRVAKCLLRELRVMQHLSQCPCIIAVTDVLTRPDRTSPVLFIEMDWMWTDLARVLKEGRTFPLNEDLVSHLIYQLLVGLHHMHTAHIVHRDIKPRNLLISQNYDLRIADFGLSALAESRPNMTAYVGTRWYRAPELVLGERRYTYAVDVWSCGCILAQMYNVRHGAYTALFRGTSAQDQLPKILSVMGTPSEEDLGGLSEESRALIRKHYSDIRPQNLGQTLRKLDGSAIPAPALELVQRMLQFNPSRRIGVREALQHPFLSEDFHDADLEVRVSPFTFPDDVDSTENGTKEDLEQINTLIFQTAEEIHRVAT